MRLDSIYFNPVEWEGTMPGMNYATTGSQVHWILRDPDTGAENMDIHWRSGRASWCGCAWSGPEIPSTACTTPSISMASDSSCWR